MRIVYVLTANRRGPPHYTAGLVNDNFLRKIDSNLIARFMSRRVYSKYC